MYELAPSLLTLRLHAHRIAQQLLQDVLESSKGLLASFIRTCSTDVAVSLAILKSFWTLVNAFTQTALAPALLALACQSSDLDEPTQKVN